MKHIEVRGSNNVVGNGNTVIGDSWGQARAEAMQTVARLQAEASRCMWLTWGFFIASIFSWKIAEWLGAKDGGWVFMLGLVFVSLVFYRRVRDCNAEAARLWKYYGLF